MKKLLPLLLVSLLFSCVTQERVERATFIAHAGGAVDSCIYTNSREALELAVKNGFRFIELDFRLTSDSVMVAAYSWSDFNAMTGHGHRGDSVPSYKEFSSRKIYGRYTPLSAHEINAFFREHPELYLVTDKISSPELLCRYFPELKERMVVEAFSYKDYIRLRNEGFYLVLYSCMATDLGAALFKNLLFNRLFPGERIEWMSLHTSGFAHPMFRFMNSCRRFKVALFTVDNYNELTPEQLERVDMIYTNTLPPQ
jgi:hypothetical protein